MRPQVSLMPGAGLIGIMSSVYSRCRPCLGENLRMAVKPRLEILPPAQQNFWRERPPIPSHFVLYGGTAIALRLGHRSSEDFDFFSSQQFEIASLLDALSFAREAEILQSAANTLSLRVERSGPVKFSVFRGLSFVRIEDPGTLEGQTFGLASPADLMAAKLRVLWQRAEAKDYLDVAAMIRAGLSLEYGLGCAAALYGGQFNPTLVLKALTYFKDGDLPTLAPDVQLLLTEAAASVRQIPEVQIKHQRLEVRGEK
jgi:Nucleotidyl transferase AbiEii toxin, Type IV TA system